MKQRIVRAGMARVVLALVVGLAVPAAAVLAANPDHPNQGKSAQHKPADHGKPADPGSKPENPGKPDDAGKPESAGDRPHNHGWYVSQAAHDKSTTGAAHGEAVSTVAQSDIGK